MNISMIVPVYRGQRYLQALQRMAAENARVLQQAHPHARVELLFVNDDPAMPLQLPESPKEIAVRVIENPKNLGIHGARVNGLNHATGEYILFLDQDDCIGRRCLLSHSLTIGDADVSVGNGYKMRGDKKRVIYRNEKKHRLATGIKYYLYAACQIVSPGQCLLRKASIPEDWKIHIIENNGADDLFLWLLMLSRGAKFTINPELIYTHVDTGKNVSGDKLAMLRSDSDVVQQLRQCHVSDRLVDVYARRIRFLQQLETGTAPQKLAACLKNPDICLSKLYAYYR